MMRLASQRRRQSHGLSTVQRYRDVAAVLLAHGLADVVDALHLGRSVAWGSRMLPVRVRIDPSLSRAARFRLTLEELGPTFVKFGQALSVRADLLPEELIRELTMLQEHVAPLEPGTAEAVIETEFAAPLETLFASFDPTPLAAASIAQVHRATLPSGEPVAVKVRRPGIGPVIAGDVEILRHLAHLAERHVPGGDVLNPVGIVEEFARTIRAEQDLAREGRNIERCARNFAGDATVRLPRVQWDRTTSSVLTLEFLDGLKLADLDATGVDAGTRTLIARRGADAMLAQILLHGFFHADPHPGNLLVLPGTVIGFLDFGIVGQLDDRTRDDMARVVRAIWHRDASELTTAALEITEPQGDVDVPRLERDLAGLIETYGNVPLKDLSARDVLTDVVQTAARHSLRIPSSLMLLIKALVTIEGVGLQLDPTFKIVEHAAPLAERMWEQQYRPDAIARRTWRSLQHSLSSARRLPVHLEAIGRKIRDGRLEIRFVHRNLDHFVREMDRSSNRLAFALIIAALVVGSSLIIQTGRGPLAYGYPVLGLAGFVVAVLFGIRLAIGIMRSGRL
jgi:ubiquinone biosynthesis protein